MKKAVVLLSGGLDSAVTLFIAKNEYECHALGFDYGQKASRELVSAKELAEQAGVPFHLVRIDMPWQGNALTDDNIDIPGDGMSVDGDIPATYVPARNIIFLSLGVSFAETIGAEAVFIGAHQLDFSNYPDCRDTFFESYQKTIDRGTKSGSGGDSVSVKTPIINMTKKEIVEEGLRLGVPFQYTWSCYRGDDAPCGYCESCVLRAKGFEEAGAADPLISGSGKNEDS